MLEISDFCDPSLISLVSRYGMQGRFSNANGGNGQTVARSRQAYTTSGRSSQSFRVVCKSRRYKEVLVALPTGLPTFPTESIF